MKGGDLTGILALSAAFGLAEAAVATSVTYGFSNITSNNATNAATGGQFLVTVTELPIDMFGPAMVKFTFSNAGPAASSITDIYFYDGALIGATMAINDSGVGVSFMEGANPNYLPGGNNVLPDASKKFEADSDAPVQPSGVNPGGEWVEFTFTLLPGITFDDVISSLNSGLEGPFMPGTDLVIGIHVQGYADGGSESFITSVPLPAPLAMGLAGLGLVGLARLRRHFGPRRV